MKKSNRESSQKKILLFDSDSDSITLMKESLADFGCEVDVVDDGFAGIDSVEEYTPDMIIADLNFPGLPGFDVLDGIIARNLNIPVIITGDHSEKNILHAFRNGASDYISKPLDSAVVKGRITSILYDKQKVMKEIEEDNVQLLLENMERNNKELNTLLKISSSLDISGNSKKELLNRLTEVAAESMNCEAASIMLINERDNTLEFVVVTGEKKQRLETLTVPLYEGIAGWVAEYGESQIVNDTSKDKRFTGKVDEESGFVTRQILAVPLRLENRIIGVLEVVNTRDNRILDDEDLRVMGEIGERAATVIEATRTIEDQQNFYVQVTNIIVKSIEKKDMFSIGHSWGVAELCHNIAIKMNLSETEKNDLHFGALLHDIGKLEMPGTIFNKRSLSERELEFIRQHPVKGAKLLEPITIWNAVVPYVLYHHEAWDGSGYPFGRSGNSIPVGARIINLTESFAIMRSPNSYKKRMSIKESILEIMRLSGSQFDPDIVKVFMSVLERGY